MKTMTAKGIMDRRKASVCIFLFLLLALLLALTAFQAGAEGFDWEPDEELSRILTYGELTVEPGSVQPVYVVNSVVFAETGEFAPAPLVCSQDGGSVYIAKLLTKDGKFGGNLQFCVKDGSAHFSYMSVSASTDDVPEANCKYEGSCSLADNAVRFEALLRKPVSTENVQYVILEGVASGFYFPEEGAFVYLAYEGRENTAEGSAASVSDLLEEAKRYKAYREDAAQRVEEWEKEHSGEALFGYTGGADTGTGLGFRVPVWAWGPLTFGSTAGVWLLARRYQGRKRYEEG